MNKKWYVLACKFNSLIKSTEKLKKDTIFASLETYAPSYSQSR